MARIASVMAMCILWFCTSAQQPHFDSLLTVWNDQSLPAPDRMEAIHVFLRLGGVSAFEMTESEQRDTQVVLSQQLFELAETFGSSEYMGWAQMWQGWANMYSDILKTQELFRISLEYAEASKDAELIANILYAIGVTHYRQGQFGVAHGYWARALEAANSGGIREVQANGTTVMGNLYWVLGDLDKALEYYGQAETLYQGLPTAPFQIPTVLNNIGLVNLEKGDTSRAIDYFERALALNEENKYGISHINGGVHTQLAVIYYHEDDQSKFEYHYQAARIITEENNLAFEKMALMGIDGQIALSQANYSEAIKVCGDLLQSAEKHAGFSQQLQACECLYEAYKGLGRGNQALEYHERMITLRDSVQSQDLGEQMQRMEFEKQILADSLIAEEDKLKAAMAHQAEVARKNKTRNIALGSGFIMLLLAGGLYSRLRYVRKSRAIIQKEKDRSENLLLNILPVEIAEELKQNGKAAARDFDLVSIIFTDFKDFTQKSSELNASELVDELNYCFEGFDGIMEKFGIEKIKTIGDAYMAAGGLPVSNEESTKNTVLAALEMQKFVKARKAEREKTGQFAFEMRAGIHTGPVVAGIVGVKKFQYDIWGDTVNTASRMEHNSASGEVNISMDTYALIKDEAEFSFESRGKIAVKGKGDLDMFYVNYRD